MTATPLPKPVPSAERTAPVQANRGVPFPTRIPWVMHERAWSQYAKAGHGSQSAERLAERGGFGVMELVACLTPGRGYNCDYATITPDEIRAVREEAEGLTALLDRIERLEAVTEAPKAGDISRAYEHLDASKDGAK